MSRSRTLAELRQDIADRLDLALFTPTTHITLATMDRWINQSVRRYTSILHNSFGENYFVTEDEFETVAQQDEYPIPADYLRTLFMRTEVAGNTWKIERMTLQSIDRQRRGQVGWSAGLFPPRYRIWGSNILFVPVPLGVHTVRHYYVSTLIVQDNAGIPKQELVADDDQLEGWNGWEEWVVLDCARKVRVTSELSAEEFITEMNAYRQEITDDAGRRDLGVRRIQNTYDGLQGDRSGDRFR